MFLVLTFIALVAFPSGLFASSIQMCVKFTDVSQITLRHVLSIHSPNSISISSSSFPIEHHSQQLLPSNSSQHTQQLQHYSQHPQSIPNKSTLILSSFFSQ
ncbi:hypothetical protein Pst134EB_002342 [Puccinia striiformis f. sp. tritici]|nr:hypothetical protein Pst134EB_002342 [Puccinia striiformis f. sp. tritici]